MTARARMKSKRPDSPLAMQPEVMESQGTAAAVSHLGEAQPFQGTSLWPPHAANDLVSRLPPPPSRLDPNSSTSHGASIAGSRTAHHGSEIGSASCRESVWQYV